MLWLDDAIGALLTKLRSLRQEENTLFIFLGDHQRVGEHCTSRLRFEIVKSVGNFTVNRVFV